MNKQRALIDDLTIFISNGKVSAYSILRMLSRHGVVIKTNGYVSNTLVNCPNCHCAFLDKIEPLIEEAHNDKTG